MTRTARGSVLVHSIFTQFSNDYKLIPPDNVQHTEKIHLSSFNIEESSVPEDWPMLERLIPPPPTPLPADLPEGEPMGNSNESGGAPVAEQERMTLLPVAPMPNTSQANAPPSTNPLAGPPLPHTSQANDPPGTADDMDVDDPHPTSAAPTSMVETRQTCSNTKRNYADLGKEWLEEEVQQSAPSKTKKPRNRKSQAVSRTTRTSGDLQLQVHKNRSVPIIAGTKYMHIDIIYLTTIEVNCPIYPIVTN